MSPQNYLRRLRLEGLEQRTPTTTLTGLVSPLGDTAQVSPLAESMGIAYVDCTLVNGPDGGGIFR